MARKKRASLTLVDDLAPHCMRAPPERWQHADHDETPLDASRPRWRFQQTRSAADRLLKRGDIDSQAHHAFGRYRDDYELGLFGASPAEKRGSGGGIRCFMDVRVASIARLREADAAVGEDGQALLLAFAVRGLSYVAVEAALAADPDTALGSPNRNDLKDALVRTLDILARHYSGDLYRVKAPVLEPEVAEVVEARPRRESKPLDLEEMRAAVMARMDAYAALGATSDAVAGLLRAEFGGWAEAVLEMEDA